MEIIHLTSETTGKTEKHLKKTVIAGVTGAIANKRAVELYPSDKYSEAWDENYHNFYPYAKHRVEQLGKSCCWSQLDNIVQQYGEFLSEDIRY